MNTIPLVGKYSLCLMVSMLLFIRPCYANELVGTIKRIKPAIVGVGTVNPIASPSSRLMATGFSILDGQYIVTNRHVIPSQLAPKEQLVVFIGSGKMSQYRKATVIKKSALYDLALLKIDGDPLPVFTLGSADLLVEGTEVAFTGFPIGAILGLYPATHQGIISSLTPLITPVNNSKLLAVTHIKRLRNPFLVYQLDATAYPGNSGSPLYDKKTGVIYGILNQVFVKEGRESVLEKPSGISYAIPVKYLHQVIEDAGL